MTSRTLGMWFIVLLLVLVPAAAALQSESTEEPSSNPSALIEANVLNVRDLPSLQGQRIGQVRFGETYPVLLGNADASWWQIQLPDATGWVSADWVAVNNQAAVTLDANLLGQQQTTITPGQATATIRVVVLNVRSEPALTAEVLTQVRFGEQYTVLQQNDAQTWWQIDVNGVQGWVSAAFVSVEDFAFPTQQPAATQQPDQNATAEATATDVQPAPTVTATPSS